MTWPRTDLTPAAVAEPTNIARPGRARTRSARRRVSAERFAAVHLAAAAVSCCGVFALVGPAAVAAAAEPGRGVSLAAARAQAGDHLRVTGTGWPQGALIQLVTCGELALPGSSACDMRAALATVARADGTFAVELTVGDPPRPCPCVVHVAEVGPGGGGGHVDAPIELTGHATGPAPVPGRVRARLEVIAARLTGGSATAAWFGGVQHRTLVYTVRNAGSQPLDGAPLVVRVGRSAEGVPTPPTGQLRPGETRTFEVPVTIPFAAFGAYPVTAELGGLGQARAVHQAYPWGLVVLNVIGAAMIAYGVLRLVRRRRDRVVPALPGTGEVLLPAVVRLPALQAYLVFDDAPGAGRLRRLAAGRLDPADLDRLLHTAAPEQPDAVVDLAALDEHLTRPRNG
ncbi:neocarzinostatin apoprotein domain-containing protein [Catellatospora tritici]|uniref:neocarzinostatin apoprotein domain-containing protein n=1 Tax=Catellatospora tritici TaxID=2851566 RepID=UPI001C2CE229|nr:neocarzinostatin apoprotein domain-containing protein [Catellatospora tritici]MBV1852672.1 hypothetical protein [Catellatospora tritici]